MTSNPRPILRHLDRVGRFFLRTGPKWATVLIGVGVWNAVAWLTYLGFRFAF